MMDVHIIFSDDCGQFRRKPAKHNKDSEKRRLMQSRLKHGKGLDKKKKVEEILEECKRILIDNYVSYSFSCK